MNFSKIFHSLEILASSWLKKERIGDAIVFIECIRKNKWKIPQRSDHSWKTRDFVDKIRKNHEYEGKREFSLFLRISFWRDSKGDFVVEKKHSHVTYCRTRICGETDTKTHKYVCYPFNCPFLMDQCTFWLGFVWFSLV